MTDSDSEPSSPFIGWVNETNPWSYLEQLKRHELYQRGIHVYDTDCKESEEPTFRIRPLKEMVADFFNKRGKTKWDRFRKDADRWILWAVTEGRLRMNRNKQLFIFTGDNPEILKLKFGSRDLWKEAPEMWTVIADVTAACNQLYGALERKLTNIKTRLAQQKVDNFKDMPEFVDFQSHRNGAHKKQQCRWSFIGVKKGGNQGCEKPAKPDPNPKHSVHRLICDYHAWLPELRAVVVNT